MHPLFLPRLVNGPFEDPGLFIPFRFDRRALLFDLGDISRLASRELLKISHAFITHTHMDHFIGFDSLLRCFLGREKELCLYGPAGFIANAEGKLAGYSWDLMDRFSCRLALHLTEVLPDHLLTRTYLCSERFAGTGTGIRRPFTGRLHDEPAFHVAATILQHSIPCLGMAVIERFHVNILKIGLNELGLEPGPWLNRFKDELYAGTDLNTEFEIETAGSGGRQRFPLGDLLERIGRVTPGQKIVYITDVGDTPANRDAIVHFARDADALFIEAAFLHSEREQAAAKHHLTARQAGEMAALAGARLFTVFHFSPRYENRGDELVREAREAYDRTLRAEGIGHRA